MGIQHHPVPPDPGQRASESSAPELPTGPGEPPGEWGPAATAHVRAALTPANTTAARVQDWARWAEFCHTYAWPPEVPDADRLVAWVVELAQAGAAPNTLARRLAGVARAWRAAGRAVPHGITSPAREVLGGYRRWLDQQDTPRGRGPARAVTIRELHRICAALPESLVGTRDRALLLVGFAVAARRAELARLTWADVTEEDHGLAVRIRAGKTGTRSVAVPWGSHPDTCPVRAWQAWRAALTEVDGVPAPLEPALRAITRHDQLAGGGLGPKSVGHAIARAGRLIGLEVTGHSLRAGLATAARRAGHDNHAIATQGGWRPDSATLHRYLRVVDQWRDNAAAGIGL